MGWPLVAAAAISAVAAAKQSKDAAAAAEGGMPTHEAGTETSSGTNVRSPYAPFQPALGQIAGGVNQAMQTPWTLPDQTYAGADPYQQQGIDVAGASLQKPWELPDQTLAGVDPSQQMALDRMRGASGPGGPLSQMYGQASGAYSQALDPMSGINDVSMGPLDVYSRRVGRNINENIMPGISQGATATGNVGSSRQGIAEGIAGRGGAEAIADYGGNLMANLYGQGIQSRDRAMGMLPQMQEAQGYGDRNLFGAGALQRNFAQEAFNDARMREEYRQSAGVNRGAQLFGVGQQQQGLTQAQLDDQRMRQEYAQTEPFQRYGAGADIAYGGAQLGGEEAAEMTKTYEKDMEYSEAGDSGGGMFGLGLGPF